MHTTKRTAALVNVDLTQTADLNEGDLTEDEQGNVYVVLHDCTSREDAVADHLVPWLQTNGDAYIADRPWEDDPDWAWLTFKDLIAYDPDSGEAAVCFNYTREGRTDMSKITKRLAMQAAPQMSIVNTGDEYDVYSNAVQTYTELPTDTYVVRWQKNRGFYLVRHATPAVDEKTYGVHDDKAHKVFRRFTESSRNLGVILSGDKGLGKSVTGKLICQLALGNNVPVIIVDMYINGIAYFLASIRQRVCVFFDEYDKVFAYNCREDFDPSTEMLSLFDGVDNGCKLFIVTCNDLQNLNDYLVNRPGRFHFHLNFNYPTPDEIREYMGEHLMPEYMDQVEDVVTFAQRVSLNYDCLRAIATELNAGEPFADAIGDLNIVSVGKTMYNVTITFADGRAPIQTNMYIDMTSTETSKYQLETDYEYIGYITFNPIDAEYDEQTQTFTLPGSKAAVLLYGNSDNEEVPATAITIVRGEQNIHYASPNSVVREYACEDAEPMDAEQAW